mmetsp:Transcript_103984/g.269198  ORF Transcript_103984/g.269198 Transcript_103984/m.269198 type:complete len:349 (-) Transcript_103984:82-1128(-)
MGLLGGCCKMGCRMAVAFGIVPLSVIIAVFLETPVVLELDDATLSARGAAGAAPEEAADAAESSGAASSPKAEFGTAVPEGFGSGGMFDKIAFVYDSTNKWMSLGLDQYWRKTLVEQCMRLEQGDRVLDLATGTADVSLLAADQLRALGAQASSDGTPAVLGIDPSSEMLRRGVSKVETRGFEGVVKLVKGDAQDLTSVRAIDAAGTLSEPTSGVADASIDKISMSFGIRNVPDRAKAFREMKRVLKAKDTSRVCILEFSLPDGEKLLSKVAKMFITKVVPFIGQIATMNSGAAEYEYLEKSILKFPKPVDFAASMAREGLSVSSITSFAFGSVHLYAAAPAAPTAAA